MEEKIKPQAEQMQAKQTPVKPVQIKQMQTKEQKSQNKLFLVLAFLFLAVLLISFMVPVYYVPLFNNISAKYGLSSEIARKLTLLDLALNSLGIETPNMAASFKKQDIEYGPDVFYTSRFESDGGSRLINAKETYYHEYERTRKRPVEVAGIYQNKTAVNTPQIDGDLKGVRALPKGDFDKDGGFTDFSYKKATATTESKDEIMGSKRRQVRGSFDRQGQGFQGGGQTGSAKKHEPLPDFAASIYDSDGVGETQTLNNSRMIKPVVSGQDFVVAKPESVIAKLVGDSSFTDTFSALRNFGGYDGALGYYVKDTLPKSGLFDFLGLSGKDVFTSYFYSHAAVGRKYMESSKHLAEIAFHGDEPQDEILVARGQKQDKVPHMDEADMSPITFLIKVKQNMRQCEEARQHYEAQVRAIKQQYETHKNRLIAISEGEDFSTFEGLTNVAVKGVPGSCVHSSEEWKDHTYKLRTRWNTIIDKIKEQCNRLDTEGQIYAESCQMEYKRDQALDDCDSLEALRLDGGTPWLSLPPCRRVVKWHNLNASPTFNGCTSREDCVTKEKALFKKIDENVQLDAKPGYMFN